MHWTQAYTPLGNLFVSAAVAALPVVVLLGALAIFHIKAHKAALLGLATALAVAIFVYRMPVQLAGLSAVNGILYGLFPIGWIVLNAIFVYDLSVETGTFELVKHSIRGLSGDRRIQTLLIAFSFGAFIEGASGFGTPVAVCAAMLIGLGFKPLLAAGIALLGNTAPVAFGALGTPVIALQKVTGLPMEHLSGMIGRQLPIFSFIIPFWLIISLAGWGAMVEVIPACVVAGLTFAIPQFLVSNYHGPWVVDIVAAIASIGGTVLLLRFWKPKRIWRFPGDVAVDAARPEPKPGERAYSTLEAWAPWILVSVLVFVWGLPPVKAWFNGISAPSFVVPWLDKAVFRAPPVVAKPAAEGAVFSFNWLSATGTAMLLSGLFASFVLRVPIGRTLRIYFKTVYRVRYSLLTIAAMLGVGFTTRFSGSDATMGLAFASTGKAFPFFSAMLGWLGVALTGSDTSSNVLFGNLQQVTAQQIGINPVLTTAANSSGGVMGKMIDAQSIVVAGVATGQEGQEGAILRFVFWNSIALAALVGVLVCLQAYVFPGIIPGGGATSLPPLSSR
jgi:lactate permease